MEDTQQKRDNNDSYIDYRIYFFGVQKIEGQKYNGRIMDQYCQ